MMKIIEGIKQMAYKSFLMLIISLLVFVSAGCSFNNDKDKTRDFTAATPDKDSEIKGKYIFPQSSDELISDSELDTCDRFTLLLAKNELFARKGYRFTNKELLEYFSNKDWYKPLDNVKGTLDDLNDIEKQNYNLIDRKYQGFDDFLEALGGDNSQNTSMDLDNDGEEESIRAAFFEDQNSFKISISSKGKEYNLEGYGAMLIPRIFFADFDDTDEHVDFYVYDDGLSADPATTIYRLTDEGIKELIGLQGHITSYDGKGRIFTDYSKTYDKYKQVLSYYELDKGVVYVPKEELVGRPLEYDKKLILYNQTEDSYGTLMSDVDVDYFIDQIDKKYIAKVTEPNEALKIVDIDNSFQKMHEGVINIRIKVETPDGKQGWLEWMNGGD